MIDYIYQDQNKTWHLSRYQDVKFFLTDPRFLRQPPTEHGYINHQKAQTELDKVIEKWAFFTDPPAHTHWRGVLESMLNPKFIKETKALIDQIAEELINLLLKQTKIDFVSAFSCQLPSRVVSKLLGVSVDFATLRKWVLSFSVALDHGSPEDFAKATPILLEIQQYFRELIALREQEPQNDWMSGLIALKEEYHLTVDEMISSSIFMLFGAIETVQLTMSQGMRILLKNPDQIKILQQQPDMIPSAVEEILRMGSPFNHVARWTGEEVVVGDTTIPKNQLVLALIHKANRDPERFPNPNEFDFTRTNNRHLSFGGGIHHCLGAMLARFELQIGLTRLLPHLHRFTLLDEETEWLPIKSLNYLHKLMIKID